MKKKFWLTLFSLASALCLCCGLVACGETPKDPDPPAASIEGVWTGATAEVAVSDASDPTEMSFTANVKVAGDTAYVVLEIAPAGESAAVGGLTCYALTKQTDGSYSFTYDPENDLGHAAAKLNSENKLEIVSDMTSAAGTEMTLTFTAKAELAAGLGLTGTWYELTGSDGVNYSYTVGKNRYDFTNKKFYAFDTEEDLTVVEVGKYTVVAYTNHMPQVIYKSGNEYFVDTSHAKLTQTAPASPTPPATDDPMDGVWTGSAGTHTLTATVKIADGKAYAVIVEQDTTDPYHYTHYRAKVLEKQGDGSYALTDDTGNYTGALDGDDLVVMMPGNIAGQSGGGAITVNFTDKAELPAEIAPSGTLYPANALAALEFDFTAKEVRVSNVKMDGVQFVNVGNYIIIVVPTPGSSEVMNFIVFQESGTYYYAAGLSSPTALTATKPTPTAAIEGVWTGGTGEYVNYILTIELGAGGETARMIMLRDMEKSNFYAFYFVLTKAQDGSYTFGDAASGIMNVKVNGTSLEFKSTPPADAEEAHAATATFTHHEDLPDALNITGTKYAAPDDTVHEELFEITFGANPAIRYNKEKVATGVTAIDVGGYKVLSGTIDGDPITVIAYKEGSTYYAAINMSDHNRDRFTLSDTEPEFNPGGGLEQQGGGL